MDKLDKYLDSLPDNIRPLVKPLPEGQLRELYIVKRLPTRKVANALSTDHRQVQKWLRVYDIPIRSKGEAQKGRKFSNEHKAKLSATHKGKRLSDEHRVKLCGRTPANKGCGDVIFDCEVCQKTVIAKSYRKKRTCSYVCRSQLSHIYRGINHWNYTGAQNRGEQTLRNWSIYREWKKAVHIKDRGRCRCCGSSKDIVAHHIQPWKNNEDKRFDINNGLTMCRMCHNFFHWARPICYAASTWKRVALTGGY